MVNAVTRLKLYDYQGNFQFARRPDISALFRIAATDFNPAITVNGAPNPPRANQILQSTFALGDNGRIEQIARPSVSSLVSFGEDQFSVDTDATSSGITQPYENYLNSLRISEANFSTLLQEDSFRILNGDRLGLGLFVETDGMGNIQRVSVDPGTHALQGGGEVQQTIFPDRAEITERAFAGVFDRFANPDASASSPFQSGNPPVFTIRPSDNAFFFQPEPINRSVVSDFQPIKPEANPFQQQDSLASVILQNLSRRQPPAFDFQLFGFNTQVTPEIATQVGAVKSGFGVRLNPDITKELQQIVQQAQAYKVLKARDGMMAMAPAMPSEASTFSNSSFSSGSPTVSTEVGADRKSAGGYVPFRTGSNLADGQHHSGQHQRRGRFSFDFKA